MLCSDLLNTLGLALDIIGFLILLGLAFPAVMRKDFLTHDKFGLDGLELDSTEEADQLINPDETVKRRAKRRTIQTCCYIIGGIAVVVGFVLQIVALYVT